MPNDDLVHPAGARARGRGVLHNSFSRRAHAHGEERCCMLTSSTRRARAHRGEGSRTTTSSIRRAHAHGGEGALQRHRPPGELARTGESAARRVVRCVMVKQSFGDDGGWWYRGGG